MKKICGVVTLLSFLILSVLAIDLFSQYDYHETLGDTEEQSVHIEQLKKTDTPSVFIQKVEQAAKQCGLNVMRIVYAPKEDGEKQKIICYVFNSDTSLFYKKVPLRWGKQLEKGGVTSFLSNCNTGDSSQIGQINLFKGDCIFEARPLSAMTSHALEADYSISTSEEGKAKQFAAAVNNMPNLKGTVNDRTNFVDTDININSSLGTVGLLICLFFLATIAYLYRTVFCYKEFAVRKMFGSTNKNLILQFLKSDCLPILLGSIGINAVITGAYLFYYNHFSKLGAFLSVWLLSQLVLAICYLLAFLLVLQTVRLAKSSSVLKNRKPMRLIQAANYGVKAIFSVAAMALFLFGMQNLFRFQTQNSHLAKWEQTKNYATLGFTVSSDVMSDYTKEHVLNLKMKKLFQSLNPQGGILFATSSYYEQYENHRDDFARNEKYDPHREAVFVNNNYLQLNKIYDGNGNPVNLANENTTAMTILVPEKYRDQEENIRVLYSLKHAALFYFDSDYYAVKTGKNLGKNWSSDKSLMQRNSPLKLNILYVKNNQKYFTYDPNMGKAFNNVIVDPVAMVVNNNNIGADNFTVFFTNFQFRAKANYKDPIASVQEAIVDAGLQQNLIQVNPLYDTVDKYMYQAKNKIMLQFAIMAAALVIVLVVIVFCTLNYLEEHKTINAVMRIHGFSFFRRHAAFLMIPAIFWMAVYLLLIANGAISKFGIGLTLTAPFSMLVLEWVVSIALLRVQETRKQKDILKGE